MSARSRIQAVLFDFDGVLVDSENLHVAAWERTLHRMACDIPPARCAEAAERDDRQFLADLLAELGINDANLDGWVAIKQQIAAPLFADGAAPLYPGASALIAALKNRGLRLAIVSGSWRANIEAALTASGLSHAFDLIIAKDDLPNRKPDPAPYLLALDRLSLKPAQAIALEDSPNGLASARAAGLRVVAVGHRRASDDWVGDSTYLPGFTPIEAALAALGAAPHPPSTKSNPA